MIDTGRRFYPVPLVESILDGMASVKMNVLHFHLSEEIMALAAVREPTHELAVRASLVEVREECVLDLLADDGGSPTRMTVLASPVRAIVPAGLPAESPTCAAGTRARWAAESSRSSSRTWTSLRASWDRSWPTAPPCSLAPQR